MRQHENDYSLARLADRAAIQDVMYRWCRAIDRLDLEAVRAVFHADAIDNHGAYTGGVDGLIAWIRERHSRIPFSMHKLGNMLIEFSGPDEAVVETYCLAIQRYPSDARESLVALVGEISGGEGACDLLIACRYIDRFVRRDGAWRIQERTVAFDSTMMIDAPASASSPAVPKWETGTRDSHDVIFRHLRSSGVSHN